MSGKRLPWRSIKRDYLHGEPPPSCADLAAKYGCAESSVRNRCAAEGWQQLREEKHQQAEFKTDATELDRRATEYAEWDSRHLNAARMIHIAAMTELTASLQAKGAAPDTLMSSTDLEKYARMAKTAMEIERTVHGRTTTVSDVKLEGNVTSLTPDERIAIMRRLAAVAMNEAQA